MDLLVDTMLGMHTSGACVVIVAASVGLWLAAFSRFQLVGHGLLIAVYGLQSMPGVLIKALPALEQAGAGQKLNGTQETVVGGAIFLICWGALSLGGLSVLRLAGSSRLQAPSCHLATRWRLDSYKRAGTLGIVMFAMTGIPGLPSTVNVGFSLGWNIVIIAMGLYCRHLPLDNGRRAWAVSLVILGVAAAARLSLTGFLGYSVVDVLLFLHIAGAGRKLLLAHVVGLLVAAIVAIVVGVGYMSLRDDIRGIAWQGTDLTNRQKLIAVTELASNGELEVTTEDDLVLLAGRLNLSAIAGYVALNPPDSTALERVDGLPRIASALVPRFFWPNKPETAGGGDMVTALTGFRFAEYTSVGLGVPAHLLAKFGLPVMVLFYIALGWFLAWPVLRLRQRLSSEIASWLLCLVVARSQNLTEMANGLLAASVVGIVLTIRFSAKAGLLSRGRESC